MAARGMKNGKYQGSKWIRPEKRLAIYLRDGMACCYCGCGVEEENILTLDHIMPYSQGVNNHESNLITACRRCNSSRGDREIVEFVNAVADYLGKDPEQITRHIETCVRRPLDVAEAKRIIKSRREN